MGEAEAKLKHQWKVTPKKQLPKPHPVDYFVPNFGQDGDIRETFNSLGKAEKIEKHKWIVKPQQLKKKEEYPVDYPVANFGIDRDIALTNEHMKYAEKKLGVKSWNPEPFQNNNLQVNEESDDSSDSDNENVQLSMERDPLLSWNPLEGHKQLGPPMDYFVPNFGLDQNIKNSLDNTALAEKITGH